MASADDGCNLSDPKYAGCDFVVATTQASINSTLFEYLDELNENQPVQYLAFLANPSTGQPTIKVGLEELLKLTGGVSPFDIPDGTPPNDPRLPFLRKARFMIGIKIQMGIPPGSDPDDTPPMVILGKDASRVTMNLLCSQLTVINYHLDPYDPDASRWNVWEQADGDPWIIKAEVDLVMQDLDQNLDTPYLRDHPEIRDALKKALDNLSSTAFSLQQLLFDLDNAVLQSHYSFTRVPSNDDVKLILQNYLLDLYASTARDQGWPMVTVAAVPQGRDPSTLQMTAFERSVNAYTDAGGRVMDNPDTDQQDAATLDYLCTTSGAEPASPDTKFPWNWVTTNDLDNKSGVVAIKLAAIANIVKERLRPQLAAVSYMASFNNGKVTLVPMQPDQVVFDANDYCMFESNQAYSGPVDVITTTDSQKQTDEFLFSLYYCCLVEFWENKNMVAVSQHYKVGTACGSVGDKGLDGVMPIDKKWDAKYDISVDAFGALQLIKTSETLEDHGFSWDRSRCRIQPDGLDEFAVYDQVYTPIMEQLRDLRVGDLHELQLGLAHNFIFPGGKTFTYKNPRFSRHLDLLCDISYVNPTSSYRSQLQSRAVTGRKTLGSKLLKESSSSSAAAGSTSTGAEQRVTATSDMMQNYIAGEIVSPTSKFEALQTGDGHALLFAIDTGGTLHALEEQHGVSHTGWTTHDLSTAVVQSLFPGHESVKIRDFDATLHDLDHSISAMMVVSVPGQGDHLLLSIGNSNQETSWLAAPAWTSVPFDAKNEESLASSLTVVGTMFAETWGKHQYIIVDVQRPFADTGDPHITRYHIDAAAASTQGPRWVKHDLTVDISTGHYQSVMGRIPGKHGDGIYTAGSAGGQGQLVYEPIINYYGRGPVAPTRLRLPDAAIPSAITTVRDEDGSTDLYTIAGKTLYRLGAGAQTDGATPTAVLTDDLLAGTETLQAVSEDGAIVIWGKNASNQLFYTIAPVVKAGTMGAWRPPMLIQSGVVRASPYINAVDGGITVFTSAGNQLQKMIQGSAAAGRIWRAQDIHLPTPPGPTAPVTPIKSYTTTFNVKQKGKNLSAPKAAIKVSANTRTPVYINGIYYVLSSTPVSAVTDNSGSLTIVEATKSVEASILTASIDDCSLRISPMDKSFDKIVALNSVDQLRAATVPSETKAGGVLGSPGVTNIIDPSVPDDQLAVMAQHMDVFKDAYKIVSKKDSLAPPVQTALRQNVQPGGSGQRPTSARVKISKLNWFGDLVDHAGDAIGDVVGDVVSGVQDVESEIDNIVGDVGHGLSDIFHGVDKGLGDIIHDVDGTLNGVEGIVKSTIGDVVQAAQNGVETVGRIIKDVTSDTLHLVAKMGNTLFKVVLDSQFSLMGALKWLWNYGKSKLQDLVRWVEHLIGWDDVIRTKNITMGLAMSWLQHEVDGILEVKEKLDGVITKVESTVNDWAHVDNWAPGLGDTVRKPASESMASLVSILTSAARFLMDKFRDHVMDMEFTDTPSSTSSDAGKLLDALIDAVAHEGEVLGSLFDQLNELASQFSSLSVLDVMKRVVALLADGILSSVQVVVDALCNVLHQLTKDCLAFLQCPIHIPVISTILKDIGFPEISIMDLFFWISATAVTYIYKATVHRAPFNDVVVYEAAVSGRVSSSDGTSFIPGDNPEFWKMDWDGVTKSTSQSSSGNWKHDIYEASFILTAILRFVGNAVQAFEAEDQTGNTALSVSSAVLGISAAATNAAGNLLTPLDPIKSTIVSDHSTMVTVIIIGAKVFFSGIAQAIFKKVKAGPLVMGNSRGVGAIVNAALIFHGLVDTMWHLYELSQDSLDTAVEAAVIDEVSNLTDYFSRWAYAMAVNDEEQETRLVAITGMALANEIYSGLKVAESQIGKSAFK
jgi:hypothetical protein